MFEFKILLKVSYKIKIRVPFWLALKNGTRRPWFEKQKIGVILGPKKCYLTKQK